MTKQTNIGQINIGKTLLKKRNTQRIWFMLVVIIPAVIVGGFLGGAQVKNPETSILSKVEMAPLAIVVLLTVFMFGLLIYNWVRFDEFERPRYDRSSSFALFASVIIVPWYVAGAQGFIPSPHPLACLFLFFGAKWAYHSAQKLIH